MQEKQNLKQIGIESIATTTGTAVGLTTTAACAVTGLYIMMSTPKDAPLLTGTFHALLGLTMMVTSPVVGIATGCATAGATALSLAAYEYIPGVRNATNSVTSEITKLSLFAYKKITETCQNEPVAELKH